MAKTTPASISNELGLEHPIEDIRHEAVLNVIRTANVLSLKGAVLFRRYGLTEAQFNVLFALKYKEGDLTQSDLGKRLVVTRASITSVLDKLEQKKLVHRASVPGNRRIYHVELTSRGRSLVERVEDVYRGKIHQALAAFSHAQCCLLIAGLERLREGAARL